MSTSAQEIALPRSAPEDQGIDSRGVLTFLEAADACIDHLHSFMLLRNGVVTAEGWWTPYEPVHPHVLFSLSKSFTATAVGLAVEEGRLSLDDQVISFFPDDLPDDVTDNLAAMRVRHLLSMSTGHAQDTLGALFRHQPTRWLRGFLHSPVEFAPGSHFVYNSGASYMLSAIIQQVTGTRLLEYLRPRLFDPLGITNPSWESCPDGIDVGGWGLSIRTEDIAKFGQLYLQNGAWQGVRLLPAGWVKTASRVHVANGDNPESDWSQGYGFQFWKCRHGAYRGDGAFGQFCVVMPDQNAVIAITAGVKDMQAVLDLVWKHLLPAMAPSPLPASNHADALKNWLAAMTMPTVPGLNLPCGPRSFTFAANEHGIESLSVICSGSEPHLELTDAGGVHHIPLGFGGEWAEGSTAFRSDKGLTSFRSDPKRRVAANAGWISNDDLLIRLVYYETPFCADIKLRFERNSGMDRADSPHDDDPEPRRIETTTLVYQENVGFGEPFRLELTGRRLT